MKSCPVCGVQMSDSENVCPACGADYIEAVISDITSGSRAGSGGGSGNGASGGRGRSDNGGDSAPAVDQNTSLVLASLEQGLSRLDEVLFPSVAETASKMTILFRSVAVIFLLLAGFLAHAVIFYILAGAALILLLVAIIARMRGRERLGKGEVIVRAAARIFAEDAAPIRERYAANPEVMSRLDAMQQRLDEALAAQAKVHARNSVKVYIIAAVVLIACSGAVGALAIHNHAARKAEAELAARPAWVKLREAYLSAIPADQEEMSGKELRQQVVRAMLEVGENAPAEEFFFEHCQGNVGDLECAMLIAHYYKNRNEKEPLTTFADKISLRYDSDTRKVKALKK